MSLLPPTNIIIINIEGTSLFTAEASAGKVLRRDHISKQIEKFRRSYAGEVNVCFVEACGMRRALKEFPVLCTRSDCFVAKTLYKKGDSPPFESKDDVMAFIGLNWTVLTAALLACTDTDPRKASAEMLGSVTALFAKEKDDGGDEAAARAVLECVRNMVARVACTASHMYALTLAASGNVELVREGVFDASFPLCKIIEDDCVFYKGYAQQYARVATEFVERCIGGGTSDRSAPACGIGIVQLNYSTWDAAKPSAAEVEAAAGSVLIATAPENTYMGNSAYLVTPESAKRIAELYVVTMTNVVLDDVVASQGGYPRGPRMVAQDELLKNKGRAMFGPGMMFVPEKRLVGPPKCNHASTICNIDSVDYAGVCLDDDVSEAEDYC
jgi:hypothetical protein